MSTARRPRADSLRNRAAILDAARELYTSPDADVSMSTIARRADVAVGTLYNHFPTKTELLDAVVLQFSGDIAARADTLRADVDGGRPPDDALATFLGAVLDASAANRAVKAAARQLGAGVIAGSADEARAAEALSAILQAGADQGTIRPDLTVDDVYLLVNTAPLDRPKEVRDRWLALVTAGIAARPGLVSPDPPTSTGSSDAGDARGDGTRSPGSRTPAGRA